MNVHLVRVKARCASEGQEDQPEHVERSEEGSKQAEDIKHSASGLALEGGEEDGILREEPCEERNARDGECSDQHGPMCPENLLAQPTHAVHVLFAAHGVNHAARGEEEQRLEERMGHQVEDARRKRADAARKKHVAQLTDGGVREE